MATFMSGKAPDQGRVAVDRAAGDGVEQRIRQTPEPQYGSSPPVRLGGSDTSAGADAERPAPPPSRGTGGFARNSVFGAVAGFAAALSSVLGTVIVAHSLGVENTGIIAFALWVVIVAAAIADLGVQQSLARYIPELIAAGKTGQADRLATVLRWPVLATACIALAGFGIYALWQARPSEEAALWLLVGLACALQTIAGFTYGKLRGEQRFDRVAVVTGASVACQLGGIAIGSLTFGVPGAIAGYCAGSALPAALVLRGKRSDVALGPELRARLTRYSLYAWAAALASTVVWSRAEVFFLQQSAGSVAVGLFSVGVTLANIAAQGPMLLTAALLPRFSESFGKGAIAEMQVAYATATRVLALLVLPACFGLAAVMPVVLPMMYGQAFADAVPAATVLVLAAGIGAISSVGTSVVLAMDRSDFIFISGLLAAALTVFAGVTVIPMFGLMGAAWARAAVQAAAVMLGCWFVLRRLRFPLPLADLGKLLLAASLCAVAARFCLDLVPGAFSLPVAIVAGAAAYVTAVRMLRALPPGDIERLWAMNGPLPTGLRGAFEFTLRLLGGAPSVQPHPTPRVALAPGAIQRPRDAV